MWSWINGVPTFNGILSVLGNILGADFTSTGTGGGLFIFSNAVQFRRNSSSGAAEIAAGSALAASFATTGEATVCAATATPAGGSTAARLTMGTTAGLGVYFGSGAPTVSAAQGSLYIRTNGSSSSTRLYVNTDGGTTWTNVTTAA